MCPPSGRLWYDVSYGIQVLAVTFPVSSESRLSCVLLQIGRTVWILFAGRGSIQAVLPPPSWIDSTVFLLPTGAGERRVMLRWGLQYCAPA
ncbi:hypothetical protein FKM82_023307 [Ascaphus truei]